MTQLTSTDRLSALRQTFEGMLNAGALRWERDPDEDLRFFIGSSVFYLLFDATDPTYVRLTMPRFFSVAKDRFKKSAEIYFFLGKSPDQISARSRVSGDRERFGRGISPRSNGRPVFR